MSKFQKFMLALAALLLPAASSFAEGETAYTVPTAVTDAVTKLEGAADKYAEKILPYIANVGLAFIGIAVVYLLFKVFKRFVGGK